jgi:hypothetical protein
LPGYVDGSIQGINMEERRYFNLKAKHGGYVIVSIQGVNMEAVSRSQQSDEKESET